MPVRDPGPQPLWKRVLIDQRTPVVLGAGSGPIYGTSVLTIPDIQQNLIPRSSPANANEECIEITFHPHIVSLDQPPEVAAGLINAAIVYFATNPPFAPGTIGITLSAGLYQHNRANWIDAIAGNDAVSVTRTSDGTVFTPAWTQQSVDPISSIIQLDRTGPGILGVYADLYINTKVIAPGNVDVFTLRHLITWAPA